MDLCDVRGLTVRFGATTAVASVDLGLRRGEVHALVGENGAGKSTILRAVAGAIRPDAGSISLAPDVRVAWVPQEAILPPDLTVEEWIFLGRERRGRGGWLRRKEMRAAAARALELLRCDVPANARLGGLGTAQRKQVQIARALDEDADVLLFDEPTAVLGDAEVDTLFKLLRVATKKGRGVLYVSHRIEEVLRVADRISVLRDGHRISTDAAMDLDKTKIIARMVGRELVTRTHAARERGEVVARFRRVSTRHVRDFDLELRAGEIVGLAGLVGAGRSELLEATAGLRGFDSGGVQMEAKPILLPEDRQRNGLVPTLSLRENLFLPAGSFLIRHRRERTAAEEWVDRLAIRAAGVEAPIASLSGGNQQKLLFARVLRHRPRLLLLDEPTAGVDVGAKSEIHAQIVRLAECGAAILLSSSDLPELLHLCDRIVAMREGRVTGVEDARRCTEERLAALITGAVAA